MVLVAQPELDLLDQADRQVPAVPLELVSQVLLAHQVQPEWVLLGHPDRQDPRVPQELVLQVPVDRQDHLVRPVYL